jgi:gas vesicle protein
MGQGTGEIRQGIEQTRARVGDEVEALAYKTDVGARLDDYVDEKKEAMTSKVRGATGAVASAASTVVPSKQRMRDTAKSNPLGLVIGGAAVGFVAGLLLPSTRLEDEHMGEMATEIKDVAKEAGQDAFERGKDVAQTAMETVKEEGTQQTRELASELKERVQPDAADEPVTT